MNLHAPPDVEHASETWGANCGPAALAAVLGVMLADVYEAVTDPVHEDPGERQASLFDGPRRAFRGYMGVRQMQAAVGVCGASVAKTWHHPGMVTFERSSYSRFPILAIIQWGGPWDGTRGASVYRHWVALRRVDGDWYVYDINALHRVRVTRLDPVLGPSTNTEIEYRPGGWVTMSGWDEVIRPRVKPARSNGRWWFQWAGAVTK